MADPEGAKKRRQQKEEAEKKADALQEQGAGENKLSVSKVDSSNVEHLNLIFCAIFGSHQLILNVDTNN